MSRAWPFEGAPEPEERLKNPGQFVARRGEGCEAVVVRIGRSGAQLVLVDAQGGWQRWVYESVESATEIAELLGVPVHVGEYPEALRVRINARVRTPAEFDRGAYPEQGHVGPVIPYPENRPRTKKPLREESPPAR